MNEILGIKKKNSGFQPESKRPEKTTQQQRKREQRRKKTRIFSPSFQKDKKKCVGVYVIGIENPKKKNSVKHPHTYILYSRKKEALKEM